MSAVPEMRPMSECNSPRWYVVRTKPKQEIRAERNLIEWGLEVLAPKVREVLKGRGSPGATYSTAPLFPCYLFARFDAAALLAKVRLTRGVQAVIGFGDRATPVDDSVIGLILSRIEEDGFVRIEEPRPGDPVTIVDGPLRMLSGVFHQRRGHDRAVILLAMVGACVPVNLPMASLRKAGPMVA
jgi:transcriptional antiterminator RfaH